MQAQIYLAFVMSILVLTVITPAVQAAEKAECAAAWQQADVNDDGHLQAEEAASLATTGSADDAAALMTEAEFMDACMKGMFDTIFKQ